MIRQLLIVLTLAIIPVSTHATEYIFSNYTYTLTNSSGAAAGTYNLQIGTFTDGFVPTALNLKDWSASWLAGDVGYYAPAEGANPMEWLAAISTSDTLTLNPNTQLYLWAYDFNDRTGGQWTLLADVAWRTSGELGADPTSTNLSFSTGTAAIFGQLNIGTLSVQTQSASFSAIPEPSTYGLAAGFLVLVAISRRRHGMRRRS